MANKRKIVFYIISAIIVFIFSVLIYYYRGKILNIFIPFFMAVIIAYILNPLVKWLEEKNISKRMAILLLYFLFTVTVSMITVFIIPELVSNTKELMDTLPQIVSSYRNFLDGTLYNIQSSKWPVDIKNVIFNEAQQGAIALQNYILINLKRSFFVLINIITMLFDIVLAMIIAYYFLKDSNIFREAALNLVPKKWRNGLIRTGREINAILSNFIQGQLLTALIVGILETLGLLLIKVKYPLILGVVGGIANIIPYFGPIIGAIPAVAVALIQSPVKALWTILVFTIVQQIDNAFISPKIIEGRLGLHPVTTILAVLAGGEFFGIIGMLIAVPIVAIIKVIAKNIIESIV